MRQINPPVLSRHILRADAIEDGDFVSLSGDSNLLVRVDHNQLTVDGEARIALQETHFLPSNTRLLLAVDDHVEVWTNRQAPAGKILLDGEQIQTNPNLTDLSERVIR